MDKLFSFVLALSMTLVETPALALRTGTSFAASINGTPDGIMRFELDSKVATGACRYAVEWGPPGLPAEQCYLDEATWIGHQSCVQNALGPIDSIIVLAPGLPCWGYDANGQDTPLFELILVEQTWDEDGDDGSLAGLIQFTAATPMMFQFYAVPTG